MMHPPTMEKKSLIVKTLNEKIPDLLRMHNHDPMADGYFFFWKSFWLSECSVLLSV